MAQARTLLNLISDILDLSKIESGTVSVDAEDIVISNLVDIVARPFRHEAESRKLVFTADIQPDTPQVVVTDSKRLQQVLKNLLSNAFKFTLEGEIRLRIGKANGGWTSKPHRSQRFRFRRGVRSQGFRHRHPGREAKDHI